MALDKLVDSSQLDTDLTAVANAIRTKGGTSASLAFPSGFVTAIGNIPTGGGAGYATGTVTPTARTTSVSFDTGLSTINGIVIMPKNETPLKSGGKTAIGFIALPGAFYTAVGLTTNNSGASWLTPQNLTSSAGFSKSGTVVTVTSGGTGNLNIGSFEAIDYVWYAW